MTSFTTLFSYYYYKFTFFRFNVNLDDQDSKFKHRILLDRKWNWPSSSSDQGLPMYRLRRKPLPKTFEKDIVNDDPLPCDSVPLKDSSTSVSFICCDNLKVSKSSEESEHRVMEALLLSL